MCYFRPSITGAPVVHSGYGGTDFGPSPRGPKGTLSGPRPDLAQPLPGHRPGPPPPPSGTPKLVGVGIVSGSPPVRPLAEADIAEAAR